MSNMQFLSSSLSFKSWSQVGNTNKSRKPTISSDLKFSRKSSIAVMTIVTLLFILVDTLILDWSSVTFYEWISGDGGLFFYVFGFGSAYLHLCGTGIMSKPIKTRKKSSLQEVVHTMSDSTKNFSTSSSSPTGQGKSKVRAPSHASARRASSSKAPLSSNDAASKSGGTRLRPLAQLFNVTYVTELHQKLAEGDLTAALDVLTKLETQGFESDVTLYNQIMRAYGKIEDIRSAERAFDRMCARDLEPNECSYSILMNMHAKADDVHRVEYWMHRMLKAGVVTTVMSYSIMIHARARHGEEKEAESWMDHMLQSGVEPQCTNYNSMIHACSVRRNVKGAEEWFEKMRSRGIEPSVMIYTGLVDACSKCLDVRSAERWMQQMLDEGIKPNVVSFSAMIDACARVGDLVRAELWYSKMLSHEVQANAYIYSALINACAKANNVSAACAWLSTAQSSGTLLDAVVYSCVINACGKAGDCKRAMDVFRQMRQQGIATHIVVYGALARPFAYQGDWQEIERIADEMQADGIQMNDYFLYTMLLAYARAKPRQVEKAEKTFLDAVATGLKINDRIRKVLASAVGRARATQLTQMSQDPGLPFDSTSCV